MYIKETNFYVELTILPNDTGLLGSLSLHTIRMIKTEGKAQTMKNKY